MLMTTLARHLLILAAILASPFYAAWIFGGWIADRLGQRRVTFLKGDGK
jgi:nitrate/nitrite transporter NarK